MSLFSSLGVNNLASKVTGSTAQNQYVSSLMSKAPIYPTPNQLPITANDTSATSASLPKPSTTSSTASSGSGNLTIGANGDAVKKLQQQLGISADGIFGNQTSSAVKAFQSSHGLVADGIVGPKTLAALAGGTSNSSSQQNNNYSNNQNNLTDSQDAPSENPTNSSSTLTAPSTAGYDKAYQDYISSLAPSESVQGAQKAYTDFIAQRDNKLNQVGDQLSPLRFLTGRQNSIRNSSNIEANRLQGDVGIAQEGQSQQLNQSKAALDYQKSVLDSQNQNYNSAQDRALKQSEFTQTQKNTDRKFQEDVREFGITEANKIRAAQIAHSGSSGSGTTGGYTVGANPAVDSWINQIRNSNGAIKISSVPANLKNAVIQGLDAGSGGTTKPSQLASEALSAISALESTRGLSGAVGAKGLSSLFGLKGLPIAGSPAADFVSQFNQVKALLSLDNIKYLKGTGAISDKEGELLANAASALSRSQSESAFKNTLATLKANLEKANSSFSGNSASDAILSKYGL